MSETNDPVGTVFVVPEADVEVLRRELASLRMQHDRVVFQRNKDWDALMFLIAEAVGDEDDREAAAQGEIDEFDPWHALRCHIEANSAAKGGGEVKIDAAVDLEAKILETIKNNDGLLRSREITERLTELYR